MSASELERLHWMRALVERRATQREVAGHLGLGVRQVQRLRDAYVGRVRCRGPRVLGLELLKRGVGRPSQRLPCRTPCGPGRTAGADLRMDWAREVLGALQRPTA